MEIQHTKKVVRESAVLTTSYVAGTVLGPVNEPGRSPSENNQLLLYVNFTKGSITSIELKVEFSEDGTTYYQQTLTSESGGTSSITLGFHTTTVGGKYRLAIPISDNYIKVSVKGTGTLTNSLAAIDAILAVN